MIKTIPRFARIIEVNSNRDGKNFRVQLFSKKTKKTSERINIQFYKTVSNVDDIAEQIATGFKHGYDAFNGGWKHHPGLGKQSFFYEF